MMIDRDANIFVRIMVLIQITSGIDSIHSYRSPEFVPTNYIRNVTQQICTCKSHNTISQSNSATNRNGSTPISVESKQNLCRETMIMIIVDCRNKM